MIFISTDILNPYNRDIISIDSYDTLIDFLQDKYPTGFDRPTDISINGFEIKLDDYDTKLDDNDVVVLIDRAALPVGLIGGWFVTALANLAISVTLSYVANKLFAPDAPEAAGTPSSVYNINNAQNSARFGAPIPIIYGKVRAFPSMIAQPFYRYENNIEYLYHVLCVGQGTLVTDEILIGDDSITSEGDLSWKLLYNSDFYNIPTRGLGYHITNTLVAPSNMKLLNDTSNPESGESEKYIISKDANKIEVDYIFPNGLHWVKGDGSYTNTYTQFTYRIYTLSGSIYTMVDSGIVSIDAYSIDAIQKTFSLDVSGYTTEVYISFEKTYGANDSRTMNDMYIKRVKELFPNEDFTNLYGDITLLVCKIKATNAVSSAGQVKVNGYFTRTDVGNTMSEVLTDIYTNTNYGGALNTSDLDFPTTIETVNCAYEQNMTIFDAMRKPALAQGYSLYLAGMDVILKKDAPNAITAGMYNEMNIERNSLKVQYLFKEEYPDYDGFECSYIDGDGWIPRTSIYPSTSTRPQKVDLFGVVDYGQVSVGCVQYIPSVLTQDIHEAFASLNPLTWTSFGSPSPFVLADPTASNGFVLTTNGDQVGHSGVTSNGYSIPADKQFKVTFRVRQPYSTTGFDDWDYVEIGVITGKATTSSSNGFSHAYVRIDGGNNNATSPVLRGIYYNSEQYAYQSDFTPIANDNDAAYHEYSILFIPNADGTRTFVFYQDGQYKRCCNITASTAPVYYLNIEGRAYNVENYVDWIKVETA